MKQSSLERLNTHYFSIFSRVVVRALAALTAIVSLFLSVGVLVWSYYMGKPIFSSTPLPPPGVERPIVSGLV